MSFSPNQKIEEIDELLTAYLDGELSPAESSVLEGRLVNEVALRTRLAELRKTYDLLDEIQETPHNQRFTRSTLELVVRDITATQSQPIQLPSKTSRWPLWLLAAACSIGFGVALGFASHHARLDAELGDLAFAANISGLADTYEFPVVVEIAKEKKALQILKKQFADSLIPAVPKNITERAYWYKSLNAFQQSRLESEREQLRSLNSQLVDRFSAMQTRIESEPNTDELQEATRIVGMVMDQIPNAERLYLEKLSIENRTQYLKEQINRLASLYYFSHMISAEDTQHLKQWGEEMFIPAIKELYSPFYQNREEARFVNLAVNRFVRQSNEKSSRASEDHSSYPFQDLIMPMLVEKLSPEANEVLKQVRKEYQLEVLAKSLFEDRLVSESSMMAEYERTKPSFREFFDLNDPNRMRGFFRDPRVGIPK
ncbi:MAG: hypothetical protein MUC43_03550 [Pirellula sp.]|jgi:hypothetical protein|nr:hypothetical protein [Pirellula sp.]